MTARHVAPHSRRPGDLLVRVGAAVFGLGVLGILGILVPFLVTKRHDAPAWLDLTALLLPAGFGLALLGLVRSARSHGRQVEGRPAPELPHLG